MSSDESGVEDGKGVIFVKDIPWRSQKITKFFQKLDDSHNTNKLAGKLKKGSKKKTWYLEDLLQ